MSDNRSFCQWLGWHSLFYFVYWASVEGVLAGRRGYFCVAVWNLWFFTFSEFFMVFGYLPTVLYVSY